ncbi:MAG TPA: MMPL family transporter [Syntrophobacter fumaroxidans]|nr:MMPL family transporter [Syntrophobacter fumaroxidans]
MDLLRRYLRIWMNFVLNWPRLVLAIAFASAIASVGLTVTKLGMLTDQLELISPDHPLIALSDRLDAFTSDSKRRFTVAVKASNPHRAVAFANELSSRIAKDPVHFQNMFYRVDPEMFKTWQLLYLDRQELVDLRDKIVEQEKLVRGLAQEPGLLSLLRLINQEMASRMVGELFTGFLDEKATEDSRQEPFDLNFLITVLEGMSSYLNDSPSYQSPWSSLFKDSSWDPDLEGYFWEGRKQYLLAFVIPHKSDEGFLRTQGALDKLRALLLEIRASYPDVQAGVTGQEALINDEMTTVLSDMEVATWLSIAGVFVLLVVFRRSVRRPLLQIISLTVGLCWTLGWTTLFVGHLNIISIVFAPLLCGLGVDSGIHWFSRLEEEERCGDCDMKSVVRIVNDRSGPGILLAGLSTTLAFLPFVLTGFRGLIELGLVTGMGILLNLFADFSVLPALAVLAGGKPKQKLSPEAIPGEKDLIRLEPRHSRLVLAGAGVLALLCTLSGSHVYFDLNPLRLQPAEAESVVWEKALIENSERSALSASSFAASPEEVRTKSAALKALRSVSEVESIFSLLPEDQEEKIPLLRSLGPRIPEIRADAMESRPPSPAEFVEVLERIRFKLQDDQAERWGAEKPLVEQMTRVRALAQEIVGLIRGSSDAPERLMEYRKRFLEDMMDKWDSLRKGTNPSPMDVENLPALLRGWFVQDGIYLLRIYPKESVWEAHALTRFVRELQSVDPNVVGEPVSLFVFATAYRNACIKASLYALVGISILLALTFRNLRLTLLALVPLGLGTLLTVGIMGVADVQFNLANSVFMPLVVGAGVEYAVVILSRWKEGRMLPGHLPFSTGKGVILAALTTTVGFGALMISHHRGIFSLGFVAWAGSLCVLVSAILVLPAILTSLQPQKVEEEEQAVAP